MIKLCRLLIFCLLFNRFIWCFNFNRDTTMWLCHTKNIIKNEQTWYMKLAQICDKENTVECLITHFMTYWQISHSISISNRFLYLRVIWFNILNGQCGLCMKLRVWIYIELLHKFMLHRMRSWLHLCNLWRFLILCNAWIFQMHILLEIWNMMIFISKLETIVPVIQHDVTPLSFIQCPL